MFVYLLVFLLGIIFLGQVLSVFQRKLCRENQTEVWVQTWESFFSLPSTLSDVIGWECLCVSLRQLNCFYPAHGAEKGREVEDKGVVVGVAGWAGPTPERKSEDTDLSFFFPLFPFLLYLVIVS